MPNSKLSATNPTANLIVSELRQLRRYAAALTGAASSGDTYVVACLEAILEAPELVDRKWPLRIALFRAFAAIWSSANTDREYATSVPGYKPLFMLLQMLDPTSRQAVLLTTLSGFTYEETGAILQYTGEEIREICLAASDFLQSQAEDDEPADEDEEDEAAVSEPFFPPADAYFKGSLAWRWMQAQRG
jgi:DNA-directed RNA polymerase specialized sigma24 family protein